MVWHGIDFFLSGTNKSSVRCIRYFFQKKQTRFNSVLRFNDEFVASRKHFLCRRETEREGGRKRTTRSTFFCFHLTRQTALFLIHRALYGFANQIYRVIEKKVSTTCGTNEKMARKTAWVARAVLAVLFIAGVEAADGKCCEYHFILFVLKSFMFFFYFKIITWRCMASF